MPKATEPRLYRRGPLRAVWPSPALPLLRRGRADDEYGVSDRPDWRGIAWPAHTHVAELDDVAVNYVDIGTGDQAVIFVHGLGGSWQNWLENLATCAANGHRCIALDLPGFGASAMPCETISITGYAATVDALAARLGLGPVALVGNSMGGFIAAETAIRHPERVERLVLVDAAGVSTSLERNPVSERFGKRLVTSGAGAGRVDERRAEVLLRRPGYRQLMMGAIARHAYQLAPDLLAEQLRSLGAPGFLPALDAIITYDFTERLGAIAAPTLIVQGSDDFLVPLGDAYEFERRIPKATTLILEDTGHVPMFERPQAFNAALQEFLSQDVSPQDPDREQSPLLADGRA